MKIWENKRSGRNSTAPKRGKRKIKRHATTDSLSANEIQVPNVAKNRSLK